MADDALFDGPGRLSAVLLNEIAEAIREASEKVMVQNFSLSDAVRHMATISGYDLNLDFIGTLTEFIYVQRQFKLLAGRSLVLVRGYADDQRAPFRHSLGGPRQVNVHEEVLSNTKYADYALTARGKGGRNLR